MKDQSLPKPPPAAPSHPPVPPPLPPAPVTISDAVTAKELPPVQSTSNEGSSSLLELN